MDHPHHKVIFQLCIVSFTFTEADQPPKINPPLFPSSPRQTPCCSSPMPHPSLWPARRINKMETNSAALFMRPCVPLLLLREQLEEAEEGQHRESSRLPGIYGLVQLSCGETTRLPRAHTSRCKASFEACLMLLAHAHPRSPTRYMRRWLLCLVLTHNPTQSAASAHTNDHNKVLQGWTWTRKMESLAEGCESLLL